MIQKKRSGLALLSAVTALLLTACQAPSDAVYMMPESMGQVASGVVAENERFSLKWDDAAKCVLLEERGSGHTWATTPYEYLLSGDTNYSLSSPVSIDYYDTTDASQQTAKALDCIDEGTVSARVEDRSLLVTYYFTQAEITITLSYTLRGDSLRVGFRTEDIVESGKTKLISVSVAPYLCSAANTLERSSYLFIPAGSGALMYTDEEASGLSREFSGEVYGYDPARKQLDQPGDEEPIRLPVFGVKEGEQALCGIIESGDGAARIDAVAGNSRNGYSAVYATFYVRGFNNAEWDTNQVVSGNKLIKDVILLSKTPPESQEFAVGYYPLSGEAANYTGMAACYKSYLKEHGWLNESAVQQDAYHLTLIGGAQIQKFMFGIPYKSFLPLTTFEQARTILEELAKDTGYVPSVLLKGFGKSGLDVGKIAGGYGFAGALGGADRQRELEDFCKSQGMPLFTDFDLVRFSQSGNGFSPLFNAARAADSQTVSYYPLKRNVRAEDTEMPEIRLLQRAKLDEAVERLLDFCQEDVSGISLSTLGQTAYSDYREDAYMLKGALAEQVQAQLQAVHEHDHTVMLSAANAYAAGLADSITDVPLQNGGYDALDETIPFYQMVYHGAIPLYSTALNLSPDARGELLRAVEAGVSPSFMLSYSVDTALSDSSESLYFGIRYAGNREDLIGAVRETAQFMERIANEEIQTHTILESGVTETSFSNGVTVIVNHTDKPIEVNGEKIPARSFSYS